MELLGEKSVVVCSDRKFDGSVSGVMTDGRFFAKTALRSVALVGSAVVRIIGCCRSAAAKNQTRSFSRVPPVVAPYDPPENSERDPSNRLPLLGTRSIVPADARPYSCANAGTATKRQRMSARFMAAPFYASVRKRTFRFQRRTSREP